MTSAQKLLLGVIICKEIQSINTKIEEIYLDMKYQQNNLGIEDSLMKAERLNQLSNLYKKEAELVANRFNLKAIIEELELVEK